MVILFKKPYDVRIEFGTDNFLYVGVSLKKGMVRNFGFVVESELGIEDIKQFFSYNKNVVIKCEGNKVIEEINF